MARFGIIGAGSWGTALALVLHGNKHEVQLWNRDPEVVKSVQERRVNEKYLPGVEIPADIQITSELQRVAAAKDCLIFAVPSHAVRKVLGDIDSVAEDTIIVSAVKGIEIETLLRVSEILKEKFDEDRIAVLSGPSHAEEVSRAVPTVVVCASTNAETAKWFQREAMSATFRIYVHSDVIGVEMGAALKNIIAIAAGIIDGVGAGDNTKAALITRALAEITRLGTRLGASPLTFAGLSGMGDLIVTCMSKYSRNRYLGEQIGKGRKLDEVLSEMVMVAEGVKTTRAAYELGRKYGVEIPIITEAYNVLFQDKDPERAVFDLMTRAAKSEDWG
ncbi:MAG: NAD(P)H-dependent glycerol-3-phosphate dehydrogenase [Calditrichaeota bacterium]|nr:MAG: NAD(P)H-dependent glycerol-3-phosphate dehydrogenase [Calditrichota bacterium]